MSGDKTLAKISHFDGHYDHWSELMEKVCSEQRVYGVWWRFVSQNQRKEKC